MPTTLPVKCTRSKIMYQNAYSVTTMRLIRLRRNGRTISPLLWYMWKFQSLDHMTYQEIVNASKLDRLFGA